MKEEDIREIWKTGDHKGDASIGKEQIDKMINQGSQNVISKFIKTLKVEKWINFGVFLGAMIVTFSEQMWIAGWSMIVLNVLFFVYYKNLIERMDSKIVERDVLTYLEEIHRMMKRFIFHYNLTSFILILPAYLLAIFVGEYYKNEGSINFIEKINSHHFSFHIIAIVIALSFALLLIHLLYGRKAVKIKTTIQSLKEEEA
ncbi:MAG: hypothetical protein JXR07_16750 [Reichenbachiella sp.]